MTNEMILRLFFFFLFIYNQTAMAQLTIRVNKIPTGLLYYIFLK